MNDRNRTAPLDPYELEDRYVREKGRVLMTGTQALVRLPMLQRELDRKLGLNTAGFEMVCEGCGDCSVQSNCLSIYPLETELGRKRKIDQSSCNKDYSCVKGFCPSFVTVNGGKLKRRAAVTTLTKDVAARVAKLPQPVLADLSHNFNLLVAGIGGTGIVTVGALITMAAHLEGKGASALDFTGFAQKGGAVISHIRLGSSPGSLNQARIADGCADAVVACDVVVATDPRASRVLARNHTHVLVNQSEVPSGQFVRDRHSDIRMGERLNALRSVVGAERGLTIEANAIMEQLFGNTVYSNVFLMGHAWQQGLIPVSRAALMRAITLNGVNADVRRPDRHPYNCKSPRSSKGTLPPLRYAKAWAVANLRPN